jgi:hypothetical protein
LNPNLKRKFVSSESQLPSSFETGFDKVEVDHDLITRLATKVQRMLTLSNNHGQLERDLHSLLNFNSYGIIFLKELAIVLELDIIPALNAKRTNRERVMKFLISELLKSPSP